MRGVGVNDRVAVVAALAVVIAALVAPGLGSRVPVVGGAGVLVLGLVLLAGPGGSGPGGPGAPVGAALVVLGLAMIVAGRAQHAEAALTAPLPPVVEGVAQLASDPAPARFDVQVVVRIDGRRYVARVPHDAAAALRPLLAGEHVRLRARTSELRGAPVGWVRSEHLAGRLSVSELERGPPAPPWYRVANGVRRTLSAGATSFGEQHRPLYLGMVVGDDRDGDELTEHRFRLAGLSHLLVVSGQNVAFMIAVAAPLLERLGRRARGATTLLLLVVFVLITRADPSVLRAATMAGLATIAMSTGRRSPALRALAVAVVLLLLADPLMAASLGFQLSVAATAGLVLLARPIERRLRGPRWCTLPASVTMAAQLTTAPLLLSLHGALPPAALAANLLAGPAAAVVMSLGATVGLVAGLLSEPVAAVLQLPARAAVAWVDGVARAAAALPLAPVDPSRCLVLAVAVLAMFGSGRLAGRGRHVLVGTAVLSVVLVLVPSPPTAGRAEPWPGGTLWVGRCGGVVVELHGSAPVEDVLAELWLRQVRRIDVVVLHDGRARALVTMLEQALDVRRARDGASDDATSTPELRVGGLRVDTPDGPGGRVEVSEAACRLSA